MSCVVQWWDVLFVKGMHFSSKNARLLNFYFISSFQTLILILTTNMCEKYYVHLVYGAKIRTHDLRNMRLLP